MAGSGASAQGTATFHRRFPADPSHVRPLLGWAAPSIGLGTYLGDPSDAVDAGYAEALRGALAHGCNLIDSAINYRAERSERMIGAVLAEAFQPGGLARDEVIVCTKGGYLPSQERGPAAPEEIVAGCHSLAPAWLRHSLAASLANLRLATIDVYYLHNPEQQLDEVDRATFKARMLQAFAVLEEAVSAGAIQWYGVATWHGLRARPGHRAHLSLAELVEWAQATAGASHHFRAVQLPYNLAMPEAFIFRNQEVDGRMLTPLEAASELGLSAVASASLLQSQLTRLPAAIEHFIPGLQTAAQRALQFARSTPGITTALVGMKQAAHVLENLALARSPALGPEPISQLFQPAT